MNTRSKERYDIDAIIYSEETGVIVENVRAEFGYDKSSYGNGYSLLLRFSENNECYDIRYDKNFHSDRKMAYLENLFKNRYQNRFKIKRLSITEIND